MPEVTGSTPVGPEGSPGITVPVPPRDRSLVRLALPGVAVFLAVQALLSATVWIDAVGDFGGPDPYMRLVRVLECRGGLACDGGLLLRSNVPFGEVLHWPFLLDRLILALSAPMIPLLGFRNAVILAGYLLGPILGVGSLFLLTAAARFVLPERAVPWVPVLASTHYWALYAFATVRPDHHGLQLLTFLVGLVGAFLILGSEKRRVGSVVFGLGMGVAIWTSTEGLISIAPLGLTLVLAWILLGREDIAGEICKSLLIATAVLGFALLIDGPEANRWEPAFDRFSVVHVAGLLGAALFWGAVLFRQPAGRFGKGLLALFGTLALLGLLVWFFPGVQHGPMANVDPRLMPIWLDHVWEFAPAVRLRKGPWGIIAVGPGLIGFLVALTLASGPSRPGPVLDSLRAQGHRTAWGLVSIAFLWFLLLALFAQVRWAHYLHVLSPMGLAALLFLVLRGWTALPARPMTKALGKSVSVAVFLFWPLLPLLWNLNNPARPEVGPSCRADPLITDIAALPSAGNRPPRVLAPIFWGPEILFRTTASIVAGPYHRNASGILDSYRVMATVNPVEPREILQKRGIDYIVLCTTEDWMPLVSRTDQGTFYSALVDGRIPDWLEAVPLTGPVEGFRIFRVVPGAGGSGQP